jgi:DNA polymerase-3 subunit epsilon/ATP-dependent DNA helicase DinG
MILSSDDALYPAGIWAVVGSDTDRPEGVLRIVLFDGAIPVEDRSGTPAEVLDFIDMHCGLGLEFAAVSSGSWLARYVGDDAALDLSAFVALDIWSGVIGIRPRLVASTCAAVADRMCEVLARLAALDPGVLLRSDAYLGIRRNGEQRLIRSALAHSQAMHGPASAKPPELAFLTNREKPERLKRIKGADRVEPAEIAASFDIGGPISKRFDAWEPRGQQREMAVAVAEELRDGGELIAEAGTGTGKSLAYLVPALTNAVLTGEQVVVATNTRVLQDQLAGKDAPLAMAAVREAVPGAEPRVQVLKGRANYLCLRRWFAEMQQKPMPATDEEASFRARANIWLNLTESGEQADLPMERGHAAIFNRVSAEGDACDASRCQFQQRNQCFLYRARRAADAAHVVITNHALLLTDVVQEGEALPEARHLIIDEAHHLEDQATNSFEVAVSARLINQVLNAISGDARRGQPGLLVEIGALAHNRQLLSLSSDQLDRVLKAIESIETAIDVVRRESASFFAELANVVEHAGERSRDYSTRLRVTAAVRHGSVWETVERRWDALNIALATAVSHIAILQALIPDVAASAARQDVDLEQLGVRVEDVENRLGVFRYELTEIGMNVNDAIHNPNADQVYWLEMRQGERRDTTLHSAPLQLGDYLRQHLYSRLDSLVLTSATMTTGGDSRFIRRRLGLEDADEITLSSPFDYESNAMILIPTDLPEPNQPGFDLAAHEAIYATAVAAGGRTLVLFTSIYAMNQARAALGDRLRDAGLQLVTQHEDGSAEQLAERLRSFDRTVVFGAGAFWEGVDVPGPALSALVIAKLPFPVPTDPIHAARSETFDNGWTEYTMPQTILKLRQGFGRLIRTQTDRGVCLILDRRLISKRYGAQIVNALPNATREYGTISQIGPTVGQFLNDGEAP